MKILVKLALLLGMFPACAPLPAGVATPLPIQTPPATPGPDQVSIEYAEIIYYDITGSTADELRVSMNISGPKDPYDGNKPVDSYTDWYVKWDWPGYATEDCDLSAASVTLHVKVILPRWKAPAEAAPDLIAKWGKYVQSLVSHEKGHVDTVVNTYLSVRTAIQNATCSTAEAEARKALEPLREFDIAYDRETKHGETQGAVFP